VLVIVVVLRHSARVRLRAQVAVVVIAVGRPANLRDAVWCLIGVARRQMRGCAVADLVVAVALGGQVRVCGGGQPL
jgi:hypothetical protein